MRAIIALIAVLLFLHFANPALAANLLSNSGFEDGILAWTLNGSTATFSAVSDLKHGGDSAVKLSKENASSWAYFYQRVPIEAGKYYKLSGWLRLNDDFITNGKLRFYWLSDSGGTKVPGDPVEVVLSSRNSDFQFIETDSIISPDQSIFAEVQSYVYLNQKNPISPLLFDDLVFENVQPTPTPTITPTPTSTPTNAPTPTKTPTPTPSNTPTPTLKLLVSPTQKKVIPTDILGESTKGGEIALSTDAESPNQETLILNKTENKSNNWFQKILMFVGIVFMASCAILTFRETKRRKLMQSE